MGCHWTGDGPLSEPVVVYDTEAYMCHSTPLNVKMGVLDYARITLGQTN